MAKERELLRQESVEVGESDDVFLGDDDHFLNQMSLLKTLMQRSFFYVLKMFSFLLLNDERVDEIVDGDGVAVVKGRLKREDL